MQDVLRQRAGPEAVRDAVGLQEVLEVVLPDVTDQRAGRLHDATDEALISKSKADGLRAEGTGLASAIASGDAKDLGGLVSDKVSLARMQVSQQALQEVGRV